MECFSCDRWLPNPVLRGSKSLLKFWWEDDHVDIDLVAALLGILRPHLAAYICRRLPSLLRSENQVIGLSQLSD